MKITIEVPDQWLKQLSADKFREQIEEWLVYHAPCDICDGYGVGKHVPGYDDPNACPVCEYEEWRNPLL
jgi:hypothetical protein